MAAQLAKRLGQLPTNQYSLITAALHGQYLEEIREAEVSNAKRASGAKLERGKAFDLNREPSNHQDEEAY
jgi:hypothetical protein